LQSLLPGGKGRPAPFSLGADSQAKAYICVEFLRYANTWLRLSVAAGAPHAFGSRRAAMSASPGMNTIPGKGQAVFVARQQSGFPGLCQAGGMRILLGEHRLDI
jgi:hypothetical protein